VTGNRLTGVFDDDHKVLDAAREARGRGFHVVDVHSPFPIHGIDEALGLKPSRLTWVCFFFGSLGAALALFAQYWTSAVDWPVNIGGKPFDSLPAFIPIVFELAVLLASLGVVLALSVRCRLWPGRRVELPAEGLMDDRFGLVVELRSAVPTAEDFAALCREYGAVEVLDVEEGGRSCAA